MARRKKLSLDEVRRDPIGALENIIVPKALVELENIIAQHVPRNHRQFVRSLTIKRVAIATAINGYVALKSLGIQNKNSDTLAQLLDRIKQYDQMTVADRKQIEKLTTGKDGVMVPRVEIEAED